MKKHTIYISRTQQNRLFNDDKILLRTKKGMIELVVVDNQLKKSVEA